KVWRRSTRPFGNGPSSNPGTPGRHDQATEAEAAAKRLNVEVRPVEVRSPGELDDVFTALTRNGVTRCCTGQAQCSWSTGNASPPLHSSPGNRKSTSLSQSGRRRPKRRGEPRQPFRGDVRGPGMRSPLD